MSRRISHPNKLMDAVAVGKAATAYSSSIAFDKCNGIADVLVISTAGAVTISQQCSMDNENFYDPVDAAGTACGVVGTALTVTTGRWVSFSPVYTPFIRFKVVETDVAATAVSIEMVYQEEV